MASPAPDRPNSAPARGVDQGVASRLSADAYYHLARTLCLTLLPPPPSDDPEHLRQRNHAAIAAVAALCPANAAEALLAAEFVAGEEQGKDCLRLTQLAETTPGMAVKCRAEARSMLREAKSALRLLLKLQDVRAKRDANSTTCNSAAWTEHCALSLMAEELAPAARPEPIAQRPTPPPEPAPLVPAPQPEPESVEDAEPDPVAEAEHYALLYPERAALIRRMRRVPDNVSFGPPDDDIVQALITARTPALAALDREYADAHAA